MQQNTTAFEEIAVAVLPILPLRSASQAAHLSQLAALGRWGGEGGAWRTPPQAQSAVVLVAGELLPHQQAHADPC